MEEMAPWYTGQIFREETEKEQRRDSCPFWNPTSTMLLERAWVRSGGRWQVVGDSYRPSSQGQRRKVCTFLGMVTASKEEELLTISCLLTSQCSTTNRPPRESIFTYFKTSW